MANPIKVVKAIGRAVGGITGKGAKSVNPVYKNGGAPPVSSNPIKVNSNPNKTPARGTKNPTQTKLENEERLDPWYDKYGYDESRETIVINSNRRGR